MINRKFGNIFPKVICCTLCNHCFAAWTQNLAEDRSGTKTETIFSIRAHVHIESIRGPPLHHTLLASNTQVLMTSPRISRTSRSVITASLIRPPSVFLGTIARLERGERVSTPVRAFYFLISIPSARQLHRYPPTRIGDPRPERAGAACR